MNLQARPPSGGRRYNGGLKKSVDMSLKSYISESYNELVHKVTWPTWSELQNSAVVVMVATVIIALVVALMDLVFERLMNFLYGLFY